ncbi:cyclic-di-AMP-binding protein CbpB [Alkalicoccus halolimnae]|uniref:Cyclic-di-AMP-binding protein CbpB n=1 Tax=Alkalicoccus halolimnae TaxID=1667239 RepID=A0A5C7FNP2_9BACI|nr:cyclic-di-AMP-binding protein CbpB [Alkalicoccus halolimnae]TXF86335.1 CBS domain-containing protein [Alkalicoccus halolimnae]
MPNIQEKDLLADKLNAFIIPVDQVAHVQPSNSLEHALLVLVKSGYTAIPVLGSNNKLHGIISKARILDSILGIERMEPERLNNFLVSDVMAEDFITVQENSTFEKVMSLSIQYPFVCVEDENHAFAGIITRSKILANINGYLHDLRRARSVDNS